MTAQTESNLPEGWINPQLSLPEDEITLLGMDGNAILGHTARVLRRAGNTADVIEAYHAAATSGDYDHLLSTSMIYLGMI